MYNNNFFAQIKICIHFPISIDVVYWGMMKVGQEAIHIVDMSYALRRTLQEKGFNLHEMFQEDVSKFTIFSVTQENQHRFSHSHKL